jgi:hypothetical protein
LASSTTRRARPKLAAPFFVTPFFVTLLTFHGTPEPIASPKMAAPAKDSGKVSPGSKPGSQPSSLGKTQGLQAAMAEAARTAAGLPVNMLSPISTMDTLTYGLENRIAANPSYPFQLLVVNTGVVIILSGLGWHLLAEKADPSLEVYGSTSMWDGIYLAAQLVMAGGPDPDTPEVMGLRWVCTCWAFPKSRHTVYRPSLTITFYYIHHKCTGGCPRTRLTLCFTRLRHVLRFIRPRRVRHRGRFHHKRY